MIHQIKNLLRPIAEASGYLERRNKKARQQAEQEALRLYPQDVFKTKIGDKDLKFRTTAAREKVWFHARYQPGDLHEQAASEEFMRRVGPDDFVLDVGAYFGWYSCLAASLGARALALEMDVDNFAVLGYNIALNELWGIETVQAAAWDAPIDVPILRDEYSISPARAVAVKGPSSGTVRALPLDDLVEGKSIQPTVIKIDVEGAEAAVLRGLTRTLRSKPTLFVEIHADKLLDFESSAWDVARFIESQGYRIRVFSDHRAAGGTVPLTPDYQFGDNEMVLALPE